MMVVLTTYFFILLHRGENLKVYISMFRSTKTNLFDFSLQRLKRFLSFRSRCKDNLLVDGNLNLMFG